MRTNQREDFIARFVRECPRTYVHGETIGFARKFLKLSKAHGNLATAYCNGDWPYHGPWNQRADADGNAKRIYDVAQCNECEIDQIKSTITKAGVCKKCRIEKQLRQLCESTKHFKLTLQQDPRGWTVRLLTPEGIEIGVPQ